MAQWLGHSSVVAVPGASSRFCTGELTSALSAPQGHGHTCVHTCTQTHQPMQAVMGSWSQSRHTLGLAHPHPRAYSRRGDPASWPGHTRGVVHARPVPQRARDRPTILPCLSPVRLPTRGLLFKCKEAPAYSGNLSEADLKQRGVATRLWAVPQVQMARSARPLPDGSGELRELAPAQRRWEVLPRF